MTNAEAKREAIREAWGDHYEKLQAKEAIDQNGYVNWGYHFMKDVKQHPSELGFDPENGVTWYGTLWRPVKLSGLHNNNGWTRIEPDGSNLPQSGMFVVYPNKANSGGDIGTFTSAGVGLLFREYGVTHYRPFVEIPNPIY